MDWKAIVKHLRERCPIKRRLVVYRRTLKTKLDGFELNGITHLSWSGNTITILVNSSKGWATQVDTLAHEWAHALWMDELSHFPKGMNQAKWHNDRWGVFYARAYRALLEVLF
jgi:predicted 3-demethylubiquinone-9 3-methyltransferase (glyoxalase superfamily)